LTPAVAQHSVIIPFDQGDKEACKPVTFRMKPAFITRTGAKRNHTPEPEQLKGTGLRVADEQPHIPPPNRASPDWQERNKARSAQIINGSEAEAKPVRKPRVARAKVSATKPDGSIPVTLGGKLPPVSVLS
jgi:hypothetical protein